MKIRTGFVSNSSSSSFICLVCGEIESGMDASASDFGMSTCQEGHHWHDDCCKTMLELSIDEKRKSCINKIKNNKWRSEEEKADQIKEIEQMDEDKVEEHFDEDSNDEGLPPELCPICTLKSLEDETILDYVLNKTGLDIKNITAEIQGTYSTLQELKSFLNKKS